MKFNYQGQIEVEACENGSQVFVTKSDGYYWQTGTVIPLDELKEHFMPADCEALNLVDPDRVKRLSK